MLLNNDDVSLSTYFLIAKIVATTYFVIDVFGCVGNVLIVYVTLRSKKLRSPCNILLGIQAACDFIMQWNVIGFIYTAYTETQVTLRTCYWRNVVLTTGVNFSSALFLFIALDRLISAVKPSAYKAINPKYYIFTILSACFAYSAGLEFLFSFGLADDLTICSVTQITTGKFKIIWTICGTILNVLVIITYVLLTRKLKKLGSSFPDYKKLNHSLKITLAAYICGWSFTISAAGIVVLLRPK